MLNFVEQVDVCGGCENFPVYLRSEANPDKLFKDFQYVCCNIPGPGMDTSLFEALIDGCACNKASCDTTQESTCACQKFGVNYSKTGQLRMDALSRDNIVVVQECNSNCACSAHCKNRVVQHGIHVQFRVSEYGGKGFGLQALQPVKCGQFICEYAGEVLPEVEVKKRRKATPKEHGNYIFSLREHIRDRLVCTFIDPTHRGNIGRFINHSCEPNMAVVPVRVFNMIPRICLFASRDIASGEELTYDYCQNEATSLPVSTDAEVGPRENGTKCLCSSRNCRNVLPFSADDT